MPRAARVGFRWNEQGKLEPGRGRIADGNGRSILRLSLIEWKATRNRFPWPSPISAATRTRTFPGQRSSRGVGCVACRPARLALTRDGEAWVATVFDLMAANYGIDRGLGGNHVAVVVRLRTSPTRRRGRSASPGCRAIEAIAVARGFAGNADKTQGSFDGDPRGRAEPLVPHGHDLSRHHQHAGDVRLRRAIRRRLVPLRRPGETAAARRGGRRWPSRLDWSRPRRAR